MKTSNSIERQEERKAARDNGKQGDSLPTDTQPVRKKSRYEGYADRIAPWRWKPGQPGNPTGKRGDLAAQIAKAVFENNAEAIYEAFSKALLKGNAYCFKELSDRGFGRLKEHVAVDVGPYKDLSEDDVKERIAELEKQLGYTPVLPPASDDDPKPN